MDNIEERIKLLIKSAKAKADQHQECANHLRENMKAFETSRYVQGKADTYREFAGIIRELFPSPIEHEVELILNSEAVSKIKGPTSKIGLGEVSNR